MNPVSWRHRRMVKDTKPYGESTKNFYHVWLILAAKGESVKKGNSLQNFLVNNFELSSRKLSKTIFGDLIADAKQKSTRT